jgi:hypothetical protein
MSSLRFLLLDNNQLSTVPREFVQAWQNDDQLSDVTLYGNPLHCDEGLESLVNLVKSTQGRNQVCVVVGRTGDKSKSGTCPVCDSPSSLQGRPIDSVTAGDLGSAPPASDVSFSNQLVNGRPPVSPTRHSQRWLDWDFEFPIQRVDSSWCSVQFDHLLCLQCCVS